MTTATISGTVRATATGQPIAGATVAVGSIRATTGSDGRFALANVPTAAPVTITADAAGFEQFTLNVTLQAGVNSHDFSLVRITLATSGDFLAYLPPSIGTYRGYLVLLAGHTGDSRPFVQGQAACFSSPVGLACPDDPNFRVRLIALAEKHGLAIVGAKTGTNGVFYYDAMIAALDAFAQLGGHPELTAAPLLLAGSSLGGCIAHDFTRIHHARVIGFMTAKGNCHLGGVSPGRHVPGYLFVAEEDPVSPEAIVTITQLFVTNRAEGALWSLMIDPPGGSHRWPPHHDLTIGWMDAVLSARLPLPGQTALRSLTESTGWLGDRSSFQVGTFACYGSGKQEASWLPSEATARSWQQLSSGNVVTAVRTCP